MTRTMNLSAKLAVLVAILLVFTAIVGAVGLYNTSTAMKRLEASLHTMQAFVDLNDNLDAATSQVINLQEVVAFSQIAQHAAVATAGTAVAPQTRGSRARAAGGADPPRRAARNGAGAAARFVRQVLGVAQRYQGKAS